MKKEILKKLTSRKFWAAVGALVTALCVLFGVDEITTEKLLTTLGALAVLLGYILTEGELDAKALDDGEKEEEK